MTLKNLSALLLLGMSTASFAFDIVGNDSRRLLSQAENEAYPYVGRLHINTLTRWQGWQNIARCSLTLISERMAITDAACFTNSTILAQEVASTFSTKEEFVSHFRKNKKDYTLVFNGSKDKVFSVRSIHFASNFEPGQISRDANRYTHIFTTRPPSGTPLMFLDLEEKTEINPIKIQKWDNKTWLESEDTLSVVSYARNNEDFLIDSSCLTSDNYEDYTGQGRGSIFRNDCDDLSVAGSTLIRSTVDGQQLLRGINITGVHLTDIVAKNPTFSQSEIYEVEDKGCGEFSAQCGNTGLSADSILDNLKEINTASKLIDQMQEQQKHNCAARVAYNLLINHYAEAELYALCSRKEVLTLNEGFQKLNLDRIEQVEAFKSLKIKDSFASLINMAKTEELIISGSEIPDGFQVNNSFVSEITATENFVVFKKLIEKDLLTEAQKLDFLQESGATLSLQYELYGQKVFMERLNVLAKKRSTLFTDTNLWKLFGEKQLSPKGLGNLNLKVLVSEYTLPTATLKKHYNLDDFRSYFSLKELVSKKIFTHREIIESGIDYYYFMREFDARLLKESGGDLSKFRQKGISLYTLISEKFSAQDLKTIGYSIREVVNSSSVSNARLMGYELIDFKKGGITIQEIEKGFSTSEIMTLYSYKELADGRVSIETLKAKYQMNSEEAIESFSLQELYPTYSVQEFFKSGSSLTELRKLYCNLYYGGICVAYHQYFSSYAENFLTQLSLIKASAAELNQAGFSPMDIYKTRKNLQELKALNKSISEYYTNGFTPKRLIEMGFLKKDIQKSLKKAGHKIKNSEFKDET